MQLNNGFAATLIFLGLTWAPTVRGYLSLTSYRRPFCWHHSFSDIRHFVSPPSQSHGSLALRALSNMIDVLWFLFWLLIISRADRRRAESRSWRPVPRAPAHYGGRTYGHLSSTGRWKIDDGERTFQNQSSVYTCASNGTWSCVTASEKKMKKEKTLNGVEEQISCF